MARAIWKGSVSFGLVNIGVKTYAAVRDHKVHFHQIDSGSGSRIRNEKVAGKSGKKVDSSDIELGYELKSGKYVTFDPDEIAELRPRTTRTIDVTDFVDLSSIDPIYYERTYWLAPDGDGAARAYGLLLAAMQKKERVGIGTVVMRNTQYLAAVRPLDGALAMSTMRFADEIVPQRAISDLPSKPPKPAAKELKMATQIIDSLTSDWDPTTYHDTYTDDLRRLIERKSKGKDVKVEQGAPTAKVIDLMEALEASIADSKRSRSGSRSTAGKPARKSAGRSGKKSAVKKRSARKKTATRSAARKSA